MRRVNGLVISLTVGWLAGTGVASAQDVAIAIEGDDLASGSVLDIALRAANLNKTESATATTNGNVETVFDFENLGRSAQATSPQELFTYYHYCDEDQKELRFSDTPREDEQDCEDFLGAFIIRPGVTQLYVDLDESSVRTNAPQTIGAPGFGGRWINFGGGIQNVENRTAEFSPSQDMFTGPVGTLDTNEWSGNFFLEAFPFPWIGGGYGYQSAGATTLNEVFTGESPFEDFTVTVDGFFDPSVHNIYGAFQFPVGRVRPFVHAGGAYFDADSGSTGVFRNMDMELDRQSISQTNSGWGPYFSVGADLFFNSWLGFRADWTYEQLKDTDVGEDQGEVDETLSKFGLNAVLSF